MGRDSAPPRKDSPILDPTSVFMLLVLAVLAAGLVTCFVMGVRWNRRHGYRPRAENPHNDDDVWWMTPERTRAAVRAIRRGETAHDHETARDVCIRARAQLIMLRNPWHPVLFPVLMVANALMSFSHLRHLLSGDQLTFSGLYGAVILGGVAVTALATTRWRAHMVHRARSAFLAHRDIAGETRKLPLPDEDTP